MHKKALHPVIAVSLLFLVSIVAVISFQVWFNFYNSDLQNDIEGKDESIFGTGDGVVQILDLIDDELYLKGSRTDDVNVTDILVDSKSCNKSVIVSKGQSKSVNIGNCLNNHSKSEKPNIVVRTKKGIFVKEEYYKKFNSSSTSSTPTQYYTNCKAILDNGSSTGDGTYTIDIDGDGGDEPFDVYCDMTDNGGGWTLVGVGQELKTNQMSYGDSAVNNVTAPNQTTHGKLAFSTWNQLGNITRWRNSAGTTIYYSKHGTNAIALGGWSVTYGNEQVPECSLDMISWSTGRDFHVADCYDLGNSHQYIGWFWNGDGDGDTTDLYIMNEAGSAWVRFG